MSKGSNSFFKIHDHLRMLNDLIPANEGILYRFLVNARLEVDENSGEILPRQGKSARQWLQLISKIARDASFKEASAKAGKLGLITSHRLYSRGERKKGGDQLKLDRPKWDDLTIVYLEKREADLNGSQVSETETNVESRKPRLKLDGNRDSSSTETETQHYKDNGYSNGDSNGYGHANGAPAIPSSKQVVSADTPLTSNATPGRELYVPAILDCEADGGIPWVEPAKIPPTYGQAVFFDRTLGKLYLVHNDKGRAFFQGLRDDYSPQVIRQGLTAACVKAPTAKARNGGLEALVRTYCGYAAEKQQTAAGGPSRAPQWASYKGGAYQP